MAPSRAPIDFRIATSRAFSVTSMIRFEMMENDATSAMKVSAMNIAIFSSLSAANRLRFSSSQERTS